MQGLIRVRATPPLLVVMLRASKMIRLSACASALLMPLRHLQRWRQRLFLHRLPARRFFASLALASTHHLRMVKPACSQNLSLALWRKVWVAVPWWRGAPALRLKSAAHPRSLRALAPLQESQGVLHRTCTRPRSRWALTEGRLSWLVELALACLVRWLLQRLLQPTCCRQRVE